MMSYNDDESFKTYYIYHTLKKAIFVSSHMYPVNLEGTQVNVGIQYEHGIYLSDTARTRTCNLFCCKRAPIPPGHSDIVR